MLPSKSELGVVIECSGTLLNFFPCSTLHPYLYQEGRTDNAWGPS
jgi:hypothetical protein